MLITSKWQIGASPIGSTQEYYTDFAYKAGTGHNQAPFFSSGITTNGTAYPSKVTLPVSAAVTVHQDTTLDQAVVRVKLAVPIAVSVGSESVDLQYPIGPKQAGGVVTGAVIEGFHSVFYWDNSDARRKQELY